MLLQPNAQPGPQPIPQPAAPAGTPDQEDLMRRIARDLVDSYDEELELEIEDRNVDEAEELVSSDKAARQAYFHELF
ncbi:MAG: putative polyphosphate kinase 2, partial [Variovorax sp.]|nr:putative polyphosphate kinase 2 [Variovorax sp.]